MEQLAKKFTAFCEVTLVFALIMFRIWFPSPKFLIPVLTAIILVPILLSWIRNRDDLASVGLRPKNWGDWRLIKKIILGSALVIALAGFILDNSLIHKMPGLIFKLGTAFIGYFFWALLQQVLLNGFLVNRLSQIFGDPKITAVLAGTIFAAVHLPNPFVTSVSWIGGTVSAYLFLKSRNVYLLALAHAAVAVLASHLLPTWLHHHLVFGPRFYG